LHDLLRRRHRRFWRHAPDRRAAQARRGIPAHRRLLHDVAQAGRQSRRADRMQDGGAHALRHLPRAGGPAEPTSGAGGRRRELSRYDLDSTVEKLREQLDEVVQTERRGIDRKLQEQQDESARRVLERMAKQRKDQLDRIPDDLGSRVKALRNYEFMDPDAEQMFNDLLQKLQQQIMDQMFQGMKQGIQSMTQQDVGRVREMVRDLNKMLEQRERGQQPDFQGFMQKYGDMFPPGIETLDQLLEHLQRQMAQMQSLLQSLSPEARDELRRLMDEL